MLRETRTPQAIVQEQLAQLQAASVLDRAHTATTLRAECARLLELAARIEAGDIPHEGAILAGSPLARLDSLCAELEHQAGEIRALAALASGDNAQEMAAMRLRVRAARRDRDRTQEALDDAMTTLEGAQRGTEAHGRAQAAYERAAAAHGAACTALEHTNRDAQALSVRLAERAARAAGLAE